MLFYENWQMALAVVLLVPLSTVISTVLAKKSMRYYDKMWQSYEDIYSCVEEDYGGIETVKSYNMEETMRKKHALINDRLTDVNKRAVFLSSAVQPVVAFTNHASFIAVCPVSYTHLHGTDQPRADIGVDDIVRHDVGSPVSFLLSCV